MQPRPEITRIVVRAVALMTLAMAILVTDPVFLPFEHAAHAQEVRERRSIIDLIFRGGRRKREPQVQRPRVRKQVRKPRNTVVQPQPEPEIAKKEDARKVLVIGDFMASALADGLSTAFETEPGLVIEKESRGSSGLVRDDHYDWLAELPKEIEAIKPSLVVVMIGANDRQPFRTTDQREKFRTDAWNAEYERRITALINLVLERNIPILWTGLPSFSSPSLSADAATLNAMYRAKVEPAGGVFVDIWDGFADEDGKFVATGSDINGQPVRLRGSDGLSLTRAGKRKMAFYIEKYVRDLSGVGEMASIPTLKLDPALGTSIRPPSIADIDRLPPMSLSDPDLDGASVLLDVALEPKTPGESLRDRLVHKGEVAQAPAGRIDDYRIDATPIDADKSDARPTEAKATDTP